MFDTMTMTKVLGAVCGSLLVFLLGAWGAETIYHKGGGHGDDHEQAYVIEVEDAGDAEEEVVEEVDFAAMMLTAEQAKGEKVFNKCKACHKLEDGANGTGPHLYNIVNREIAVVDGYGYSDALASLAGQPWDYDALNGFLEDPRGWAPGTKMGFNGLNKVEDRANLIAYLEGVGG